MIESPGILWTLLFFALALGPLVFLHELGHYYAGRIFGVKADAFSIGFGREIYGWTDRRGTRWKLGWIPLGGYVRFAGDMSPASEPTEEWLKLPPEERNLTFQSKPLWQRSLIVLAGPMANFLFAIAVFIGLFGMNGEPRTPPVVAAVIQGSAAEKAGLRAGDRIVEVAGRDIGRFEDIGRIVQIRPGEALDFEIERGGQTMHLIATPAVDILRDRFGNEARRGLLGISAAERVVVELQFWELPGAAVRFTVDSVRMMAETLGQLILGQRSIKELGGPVKIAQISGQQATLGPLDFILFMTMISINLGFINLLPVPMLDGGHLFFYAIEAIRRKPVSPRVLDVAFRSGLFMLLTLTVFVTFNDLGSVGLWNRLAGLIG